MINFKDATAMAQAVKTGQVTPFELVSETIKKTQAINPIINAVTSERFQEALHEAKNMVVTDQPFAGVPIFLKDLGQEQIGQLSTSGSKLFEHYRATKTDHYVQRLKELGFIILGRSNTPEFGFKNISDSQLHGPVNLPQDVKRNAGGSSGGAAALLSAGITQLSPASDGGGSIRIPASFNGLIGLKPSRGRIPVGPGSYRGWQGASVHFALTKSVRDTKQLLYHLQTYQLESPFPLSKLSAQELFSPNKRSFKIAVYDRLIDGSSVSKDASQALEQACQQLIDMGHDVVRLEQFPVDMSQVIRDYYIMNSVETAAMFATIEASMKRVVTKKDMEIMTWAIYQAGKKVMATTYSQVLQKWDQYAVQMARYHDTYDLLLTFTTNTPAPKHGDLTPDSELLSQLAQAETLPSQEQLDLVETMFEKSLGINPYTALANLTGQSAISLPTYQTAQGLPMGIQFIASKGREDLLLAVAEQFERSGLFQMP